MNEYICLVYLLLAHFIADFVFQSRWMGDNKYKSLKALSAHVLVYTFVIGFFLVALFALGVFTIDKGFVFIGVTFCAHFLIDFFTSKLSHSHYEAKEFHAFWMTIGFDQFLHAAQLIGCFAWLNNL